MNPRFKKIFAVALRIPILVSLVASVILLLLYLPGVWRTVFAATLFAATLVSFICYGIHSSKMDKCIEALLDILYKEVNPEKFIRESEEALRKTKSRAIRNTFLLNLAVGYEATGRFDEAIRIMKEMDISTADKVSKAIFYANAASFYAENGSVFEAEEAYTSGRPYFEKAAKRLPSGHMQLARGLLYFVNEQYADAADAFEKARGKGFEDRHTLTKCQLFEARALAQLGKTKESKALYHKIQQKKTYPYLLECAKAELLQLEGRAE